MDELARMIGAPGRAAAPGGGEVMVRAVEEVTDAASAAAAAEGIVTVNREQLKMLAEPGASVIVAGVTVVSVPDAAHYSDRAPGLMVLPSTGEVIRGRWPC